MTEFGRRGEPNNHEELLVVNNFSLLFPNCNWRDLNDSSPFDPLVTLMDWMVYAVDQNRIIKACRSGREVLIQDIPGDQTKLCYSIRIGKLLSVGTSEANQAALRRITERNFLDSKSAIGGIAWDCYEDREDTYHVAVVGVIGEKTKRPKGFIYYRGGNISIQKEETKLPTPRYAFSSV